MRSPAAPGVVVREARLSEASSTGLPLTADGLVGVNRQFKAWLTTKNVRFTEEEAPEVGHVWPLWRQNLSDNTRYRFVVTGELWERIGTNWVKATKRNGQSVSEARSSIFSTGVSPRIPPPAPGPPNYFH